MRHLYGVIIGSIVALVGFGIQCFGMIAFGLDPVWQLISPYNRAPLILTGVFCGSLFILGFICGELYDSIE